nr:hypothetical protein [Actinomycetales bacterium]
LGEDPDNTAIFEEFMDGVGAMAMGATTYRWLFDELQLGQHPERWLDVYGQLPTWVFTHHPLPVVRGANVRFVAGEVAAHHPEMVRAAAGANVWIVGGGPLAAQFAQAGLLDEIILSLAPVTLGAGRPVMPLRLDSGALRLASVQTAGAFVALRYELVKGATAEPGLVRDGGADGGVGVGAGVDDGPDGGGSG